MVDVLRDYISSIFALLIFKRSFSEDIENSSSADQSTTKSTVWVSAVISLVLGTLAFGIVHNHEFDFTTISINLLLFTFWMWLLFSIFTHVLIKIGRGHGTLWDTVITCLEVMPVAYVLSAFCAATWACFARAFSLTGDLIVYSWMIFLGIHFLLITIYLPYRIKRIHQLHVLATISLSILLPAFVLAVNGFLLLRHPEGRAVLSIHIH